MKSINKNALDTIDLFQQIYDTLIARGFRDPGLLITAAFLTQLAIDKKEVKEEELEKWNREL